jgi:hypothetical protein
MNLKAYCCETAVLPTKWWTCKEDEANFPKIYPESYFLYDHLVDIW